MPQANINHLIIKNHFSLTLLVVYLQDSDTLHDLSAVFAFGQAFVEATVVCVQLVDVQLRNDIWIGEKWTNRISFSKVIKAVSFFCRI